MTGNPNPQSRRFLCDAPRAVLLGKAPSTKCTTCCVPVTCSDGSGFLTGTFGRGAFTRPNPNRALEVLYQGFVIPEQASSRAHMRARPYQGHGSARRQRFAPWKPNCLEPASNGSRSAVCPSGASVMNRGKNSLWCILLVSNLLLVSCPVVLLRRAQTTKELLIAVLVLLGCIFFLAVIDAVGVAIADGLDESKNGSIQHVLAGRKPKVRALRRERLL